jgi:hypothetical protein
VHLFSESDIQYYEVEEIVGDEAALVVVPVVSPVATPIVVPVAIPMVQ